ncbi:MAG: hypothetical protein J0L84_20490, partial [Verrucomicrobia bacterium]|nr:hypothetical protein [Verrucomicrobiota bacterium]
MPGNQILTSAQGLEWASRILVRVTQDAPLHEARVSHWDPDRDLAVLTVDDPDFFAGLEPLDRETLLSLVSGNERMADAGGWPVAPESEGIAPDGEAEALDRGSLALRTWAKTREDRAEDSQGAGSLPYAVMEAPAGAIGLMAAPAPLTLADFSRANEAARFTRANVNVAVLRNEGGPALRLTAATPTADSTLVLNNATGWNLSGHGELTLFIKNNGPLPVTNTWSLVNAAGRQVSLQTFLAPGSMRTLRIPLVPATYTPAYTTSTLRGIPKATLLNNMAMDLARVIRFQVTGRLGTSTLEIGNLVAKESPMPVQNPFPLVDDFGQYRFLGWDGKVTGVSDLTAQRDRERAELASNPRPANWNEYGGWTGGPQLAATGHFRTEKYQGRWYFVDPAGRLFFSMAVKDVNDRQDTAL